MADTSPRVSLNTRELAGLASMLLAEVERQRQNDVPIVTETKQKAGELIIAAHKLAASHSGSNFGYHGALYYRDFEAPPLGSMFSVEWGGVHGIPSGWRKRDPDEVKARIEAIAALEFTSVEEAIKRPLDSAKRMHRDVLIQLAPLHQLPDSNREKQLLQGLEGFNWRDSAHNDYAAAAIKSYPNMTRDSSAFTQGCMLTSHDYYAAVATQVEKSCEAVEEFWTSTERLLRQLRIAANSKLVAHHDPIDGENLTLRYERLRLRTSLLAALLVSFTVSAAAAYAVRQWRWEWLLSHPNSYAIQGLSYVVLLLFLVGLFVRKFRSYCWGFALIPLLIGVLQLLGGPASKPH